MSPTPHRLPILEDQFDEACRNLRMTTAERLRLNLVDNIDHSRPLFSQYLTNANAASSSHAGRFTPGHQLGRELRAAVRDDMQMDSNEQKFESEDVPDPTSDVTPDWLGGPAPRAANLPARGRPRFVPSIEQSNPNESTHESSPAHESRQRSGNYTLATNANEQMEDEPEDESANAMLVDTGLDDELPLAASADGYQFQEAQYRSPIPRYRGERTSSASRVAETEFGDANEGSNPQPRSTGHIEFRTIHLPGEEPPPRNPPVQISFTNFLTTIDEVRGSTLAEFGPAMEANGWVFEDLNDMHHSQFELIGMSRQQISELLAAVVAYLLGREHARWGY
ncbi:hypothetical protein LTR10_008618 [Elasticomyces elasticus]|nr:hypothetical protein LTR10_008618 [Elasticomyces elasticus]KAK4967489.1 hypothetical protein LTR42_010838 [Elasticomyces elasticus]